jgi:hypothetical protein
MLESFMIIGAMLAVLRLIIWPGHKLTFWGSVEAVAHIWVGFAIGALTFGSFDNSDWWLIFWSLAVPSTVELIMAILYLKGIWTR